MSFGELCILVIVAVVVIGPKDLPRVLRKAGQYAGKLRRLATDVRAESGIDEMLRSEGLHKEIAEIRRLAQGDFMGPTARSDRFDRPAPDAATNGLIVSRDREYPCEGADSHSAIPDTAHMYAKGLPKSPFALDPLYVMGDASAVLPSVPTPPLVDPASDVATSEPETSAPAAPTTDEVSSSPMVPPHSVGHA